MNNYKASVLLVIILITIISCTKRKSQLKWEMNLPVIGSQSSLRATDLNNDGVLDLVIGAGKNEFQFSKQGILAINGLDGAILWTQEASDQVFGSATFTDITGDGNSDVIIGGRSAILKAIDGLNGKLIWQYEKKHEAHPILKYANFNFYNSIVIPDQNNDGIQDLLTVNGGNSKAAPNSTKDRYPGVLMVFDSKSGDVLAADTMPDGKETYMTPICIEQYNSSANSIIFGTGGETIDGGLYKITLEEFTRSGLMHADKIASEIGHGFIAPPTAVDITKDGVLDVIAISHGSTIYAINGKNDNLIWKNKIENTESSNSFSVGYFNRDEVPDLFTFVSKGKWPDNRGSMQIMLNGMNGNIEFIDSIGCTGFSSPVIYDFNNDGIDDAIISVNEFDCSKGFIESISSTIVNKLVSVDFTNHKINIIDQSPKFKNIFTTPWIGDIDNDNYVDIVYAQYFSESSYLTSFLGMRVRRISTSVRMRKPVIWGAYMGSKGDGKFILPK